MDAEIFNVLMDSSRHKLSILSDSVALNFDRSSNEIRNDGRIVVWHLSSLIQTRGELFVVVGNIHCGTAQIVGRPDQDRIPNVACL